MDRGAQAVEERWVGDQQRLAERPAPELPEFEGWDWLVEISYRPGVTDTLALTAREPAG